MASLSWTGLGQCYGAADLGEGCLGCIVDEFTTTRKQGAAKTGNGKHSGDGLFIFTRKVLRGRLSGSGVPAACFREDYFTSF
jgi:hypothetical protein